MACPQPTDAHGVIAHDIQENILVREFTKQQLKILYLIIRLSWGCGCKAWKYKNYKDFEIIGLFKSDVARNLEYLKNNRVIDWMESYNLLIFNKNYDLWTIPKKNKNDQFNALVHESLNNANTVSNLLTTLVKSEQKSSENTNGVSEIIERLYSANTDKKHISGQSKESILNKDIYTHDFERFYSEYPRPEDKRRTFKNWKTCIKNYSQNDLLKACDNYKKAKAGTEKQYLKSSANFLGRDKPFEDYIDYEPEEEQKTRGW